MRMFPVLLLMSFVIAACADRQVTPGGVSSESPSDPGYKVVLMSEVVWEQLNPARGANSPMAATLWGDRTGPGPSGFLLKPVDGFKSPPHIHTADYHGVVIKGTIHNAEPEAQEVYLPPGSFWTQPGGGVHITAAKGSALAYIEVEGEFDVLPAEMASNNTTKAVAIPASNIAWVDQPGMRASPYRSKVAELWSDPGYGHISGTFLKLPSGSTEIPVNSHGNTLHAVVIQGRLKHRIPAKTDYKTLEPGSYFGSEGRSAHRISCEEGDDCIIYVRKEFKLDDIPVQPNK